METTAREPFHPEVINIYGGSFERTIEFLEYIFEYSDIVTDPPNRDTHTYESFVSEFFEKFTMSMLFSIANGNYKSYEKMFNEIFDLLEKQVQKVKEVKGKRPKIPTNRHELLIVEVEMLMQVMGTVLRNRDAGVNRLAAIGSPDALRRRALHDKIIADKKITRSAILKSDNPRQLWDDLLNLGRVGLVAARNPRHKKIPDEIFVPTFGQWILMRR